MAERAAATPAQVELGRPLDAVALGVELGRIVAAIPPEYVQSRRWFGSKRRPVRGVTLRTHAPLLDDPPAFLILVEVQFRDGGSETYSLPLCCVADGTSAGLAPDAEPILTVRGSDGRRAGVYDGLGAPELALRLPELMRAEARLEATGGMVICTGSEALRQAPPPTSASLLSAEQSNTSVVYDDRWIMKTFRRISFGTNRDLESARFFADHTRFRATPLLAGSLEYRAADGRTATLAMLQALVQNRGDGWSWVLGQLGALYREVGERGGEASDVAVDERAAGLIAALSQLGSITGEMHLALGSRPDIEAFAPVPLSAEVIASVTADARRQAAAARGAVATHPGLVALLDDAEAAIDALAARVRPGDSRAIQIHGDYHLGQVLKTDDGWVLLDFEGEPARPLEERREKQSPLRDVAGMLRSFNYAGHAGLRETPAADRAALALWANAWERAAGDAYARAYEATVAGSGLIPESADERDALLELLQLGKALYELNYELNNRPDWVSIPLEGIRRLVALAGEPG